MCKIEDCNNNFIYNKKYGLCELHNWLRVHKGKTEKDFYNRYVYGQNKKLIININKKDNSDYFLKKTKLKNFSNKNLINYNKKKKSYNEIDLEREQICEGCGNNLFLSRSHLISVKERKDLEDDKNNIRIYCMQRKDGSKGCHQRWESNLENKKTLLDFEENMEYIKKMDIKIYNKILLK